MTRARGRGAVELDGGQVFTFAFEPLYRRVGWLFGVSPSRAGVEVGAGRLQVRFGPWRVSTAVTNVTGHVVTGPYAVPKTLGPPRLSLIDRGVTFATNRRLGLCVCFREPVQGIDWVGMIRHPGMTVTVADVHGLATAIDAERRRVEAEAG